MHIIKKINLLFCLSVLVFVSGCKSLAIKEIQLRNSPFVVDGKVFDKLFSFRDVNGNRVVEIVSGDETRNDWTKLVTVRSQSLPLLDNDPVNAAQKMLKLAKIIDKNAIGAVIENEDKTDTVVDFFVVLYKKEYMEYTVIRYIQNRYKNGLISLQFSKRMKLTEFNTKADLHDLRKSWMHQITSIDMKEAGSYVGEL